MCLRELLQKEGKLKIMRNCSNLIRCLPLLMHDKKRVGDAATNPHAITHAPDALRYFAVSRYAQADANDGKNNTKKLKDSLKIKKEKYI